MLVQIQLRSGGPHGEILWFGQRDDYPGTPFDEYFESRREKYRTEAIEENAEWVTVFEDDPRFVMGVAKDEREEAQTHGADPPADS